MGFGKNPHVAKATVAEQKAQSAGDDGARALAWREAARHWERAAEREQTDKRRGEYTRNAEAARAQADGAPEQAAPTGPVAVSDAVGVPPPRTLLN